METFYPVRPVNNLRPHDNHKPLSLRSADWCQLESCLLGIPPGQQGTDLEMTDGPREPGTTDSQSQKGGQPGHDRVASIPTPQRQQEQKPYSRLHGGIGLSLPTDARSMDSRKWQLPLHLLKTSNQYPSRGTPRFLAIGDFMKA